MAIGAIAVVAAAWPLGASLVYSPEYVFRCVAWGDSDVGDYLNNFPKRALSASRTQAPFRSAQGDERVPSILKTAFGAADLDAFLKTTQTQSVIVIKDGRVLFERYATGWRRDSMVTSFSVAKSFVSTLIGIAIEDGAIHSVDDPITMYLPELATRDARFAQITIRHLLTMSSGLRYEPSGWFVFNGDDPLTSYHTDQRKLALTNTEIVGPPGVSFRYNKYHPQLLGMILERTTKMSVTAWTQSRLWDPLGMEFDGAWTLDSEGSGFEKMEAGLNARAIDFAKLGQLFLDGGRANGKQVLSAEWVGRASGVDPSGRGPQVAPGRYYAFFWWGIVRESGSPDFYALGDHGQYIYVSPQRNTVIVRTGVEYGVPSATWLNAFKTTADLL